MARKGSGLLWALGIGGAVFLLSRKGHAMSSAQGTGQTYKAPLQLSKNFNLTEFLQQHAGLLSYALNQDQFDAVSRLATKVLQPARDKFGPLRVASGCRPPEWHDDQGRSLDDILKAEGYHPAEHSDHDFCGAADIIPDSPDKIMPLAIYLAGLPDVRQVIVEYRTVDGQKQFNTVHVAVTTPGRPKITTQAYAFIQTDGKTEAALPWQQPLTTTV